ncbi:MAG: hypothetical protein HC899_20040 [Leptolyngbyaceae cyanobacterium SM1_4_3]|nr:hypothetical protein [Leptolyngbyaceae cyanobacterium SM1_4_3]
MRYFKQEPAPEGYLKELMTEPRMPDNDPNEHSPSSDSTLYPNPVIINEYGWIWVNRDGSTTTLTNFIYKRLFPDIKSPQERYEIYAKTLAIKTEYWRAHRQAAAVMHFCGLGYSRPNEPRGQTSDNFIDLKNLVFEPHFYKYVRPSFSPLGIMLDFWDMHLEKNQEVRVPIHVFNDTYLSLKDSVQLNFYIDEKLISSQSEQFLVQENGKAMLDFSISVPDIAGKARLEGVTIHQGDTIKSIREFTIDIK